MILNRLIVIARTKYLWLILVAFLSGLMGIYIAFTSKPIYRNEIDFNIISNGASLGGVFSSLSQLGISGSNSSDYLDGYNLNSLLKSRKIFDQTIESKSSKNIVFLDLFMKSYNIDNVDMKHHGDSVRNFIYVKFVKEIDVTRLSKDSKITRVTFQNGNEQLTTEFPGVLLTACINYYDELKSRKFQEVYGNNKMRADSVYNNYKSTSIRLDQLRKKAEFDVDNAIRSEIGILEAEKIMSLTLYSEIVKNLEMSVVLNAANAPEFDIINYRKKAMKIKKSKKIYGIVFSFFGFGITFVVFFLLDLKFKP